jgi:cell shape-determining protein MreC
MSHRKETMVFGGYGRGIDNKMYRDSKHKYGRLIDKRRRENKKECERAEELRKEREEMKQTKKMIEDLKNDCRSIVEKW